MMSFSVFPVPAFNDNYMWVFFNEKTRRAFVVDPGSAVPLIAALEQHQLTLSGILLTHHHQDHSGGIAELVKLFPHISIYGSVLSPIKFITHRVAEHMTLECGLTVLEIPGHTLDHIAFYNKQMVFPGDTLFSAGCGRVFEGSAAQMYQSLQKLAALPDKIHLYCGHEYTLANLHFAHKVEPENQFIINKLNTVTELRKQGLPTLPSLLAEEKQMNPFLRCDVPSVIKAVERITHKQLSTPIEVFAQLREWKNNFIQ